MSAEVRNALDLVFAGAGGRTVLTRRRYRWPLLIGRVFRDPSDRSAGTVVVQNSAGTIVPGDVVRQRIEVVDGGAAVLRGQGATMVSGVTDGKVAVEDTEVWVDATSRLLLDTPPRILTELARYRNRIRVCVAPGGCVVLADAVVLHPELTAAGFGSYESSVAITSPDGALQSLDAQLLDALPAFPRSPMAFGTVFVIGTGFDRAMTAASPGLETLAVLTGGRTAYVAASDLPNSAGWAVRIAASDGGTLRATIGAVTALVEAATRVDAPRALADRVARA